ncbi:MAG: hypothetical protein GTO55_03720, partial [Armatimonadetes bacterium]|nr:hypothetical protein [Armatimonadota bacterium]NIM23383.1 hypothetical protein [Armatimonadota bacterium]NIM67247.1 hypothetical protein [Armatimonadota bacterium]NIM75746.1 hypothetical protein [Armatimonadota bacterium]NIN05434.1 hypothetical protein [Armatimonadota bacterium]
MDRLLEALAEIAASVRMRPAAGIFRLPIDRVFTMKGAGTVITGTVVSGSLKTGEKIECLPQGKTLRLRGLQVHNQVVKKIAAGQRAAINLADIEKEDIHRGDMLATPGSISPTLMLDVRVNLSERAPKPLAQRTRLRVHHGTKEVMARIVLLEGETLSPGESALCQLRLEAPLAAAAEDAFVLRTYSPMRVIGGGTIVDPHPPKRKKVAGADGVAQRESLPVNEVVLELLDVSGANGLEFKDIRARCGLSVEELRSCLDELQVEGQVHAGRRERWFGANAVKDIEVKVVQALAQFHRREPLRAFVPLNLVIGAAAPAVEQREGLRLALEALVRQGMVVSTGDRTRLAGHQPQWSGHFATAREKILAETLRSGLAVPSPAELAAKAGLKEKDCQRVLEA